VKGRLPILALLLLLPACVTLPGAARRQTDTTPTADLLAEQGALLTRYWALARPPLSVDPPPSPDKHQKRLQEDFIEFHDIVEAIKVATPEKEAELRKRIVRAVVALRRQDSYWQNVRSQRITRARDRLAAVNRENCRGLTDPLDILKKARFYGEFAEVSGRRVVAELNDELRRALPAAAQVRVRLDPSVPEARLKSLMVPGEPAIDVVLLFARNADARCRVEGRTVVMYRPQPRAQVP
jgi:hypothetical protein